MENQEPIGPFEIDSYQLGFQGNPEGDPKEWNIIINIGCNYEPTDRSSTFSFTIDRDGAKRLAVITLSHALSLSIDESDALSTLEDIRKRLDDLLPDPSTWIQDTS